MKLTERYIQLCRDLADAGYVWNPRPGDWILDITDESIGMLTTYIEQPERLRAVNIQIPYGLQIHDLLLERKCSRVDLSGGARWDDRVGVQLYECDAAAIKANEDEEALAALVIDFQRFGT